MLNYHNIGTIYMKGYIPPKPQLFPPKTSLVSITSSSANGPVSLPPNSSNANMTSSNVLVTNNNNSEINSKTFNTSGVFISQNGFTEELNRKNMNSQQSGNHMEGVSAGRTDFEELVVSQAFSAVMIWEVNNSTHFF